jgi:nucleoside-diphosphate-sugar epimerase
LRILITGGAGYIGSILVPMALARGHEVTVVDSLMYGQASLLDCCHDKRLRIIRGDVRDSRLLMELAPKFDAILPLACLVGAPLCAREPQMAAAVNRDAVRVLADALSPQQMLVFPSTNSGYGIGSADVFCDEETPLNPISLYGRLKVEIETLLLERGNAVTFRLATVFGISPRMRLDLLVNDFVYRAVTDRSIVLFEPHFKRNYLHVRDAARAFLHAIDNFETMKGRPYNIGLSDANLSKMELCDRIRAHVPELCTLVAEIGEDPDKRNYVISNARIEATGFRTETGLDDGIAELVKGYQVVRRNQYSNV